MRERLVAVQCEFAPEGSSASALLEEAFARFLRRVLAGGGPEAPQPGG